MALTKQQLALLPASVQALLASQQQGDQQLPQQTDPSAKVMTSLQQAIGRRFGEGQEFDAEYDSSLRGLMGEVPTLQAGFQKNRQRLGEDFTQTAEGLDKQNTQNRDRHLNSMADRGLGFSGANLVGQERVQEGFQKGVQGASQAYGRALDDVSGSEADAFRRVQERSSNVEASAGERARVRDEKRKWEQEQMRMEQERMAREQQQAEAQLAEQQRQYALLEQQALAASQPMPTATGSYSAGTSGGGGGGGRVPAPRFNTDTNVSVNFKEYNLRDPTEIKQLQSDLGLRADGIMGPQTITALQRQNAQYFNDRPIDFNTRLPKTNMRNDPVTLGGGYFGRSGRS